jgi:penicillin-binding protein 1A
MRIERALPKERILELYLNEIYLGLSSYGVAAASQAYFNKPLDQLDIAQAAFLGALPKAPNNYNPFRYPDAAKARRDWVIDRMHEDGYITAQQAQQAKAEPLNPAPFHRPDTVPGSEWFAEEVRRQLIDTFGAEATTQGGFSVSTSLNPTMQLEAERALHDGLMIYDRAHGGWRGPVAHLDGGPALKANWQAELAKVARPAGMLRKWQLAVVLEEKPGEATLGWLTPSATDANAPPTPHTAQMLLSDTTWARPVKDGRMGGTPRRMADVMKPGDVVMAELMPETPAPGTASGKTPTRPERLVLRQIPQVQGAMVAMDPTTGRVLAIVGGWSFDQSQFDRATQAMRQPGSSFKPFVYLTALEKGISPSQRFLDAPFVLNLGAAGVWRPGNYENTFEGPTPLRIALEKSLNLVTIRVADHVGMAAVADTAKAFHVVDNMPLVLPGALGAVETTVLRQAAAYASLAEGGREVVPTFINSVQDHDGHVIWRPQPYACEGCDDPSKPPTLVDQRKQIADPQSVYQLVKMMEGVVRHGTGYAAGKGLDYNIAGKTGTTQDWQDAWFVGFTPDLVTAVWVGFDQPQTLGEGEQAATVAAPIWHDFMQAALKGHPKLDFVKPDGVTLATWQSGFGPRTDAFKPGQIPGASSGSMSAENASGSGDLNQGAAPSVGGAGVDSGLGGLY